MYLKMSSPPAWKISEKLPSKPPSENLGPGAYNPYLLGADSPPQYSFGSQDRLSSRRLRRKEQSYSSLSSLFHIPDTPGPGAYSIARPMSRSRSFSLSGGHSLNLNADSLRTPAPNHYSIPTGRASPTYKFSVSKRKPLSTSCSPGPGTYSHSPRHRVGGSFSKTPRNFNWGEKPSPGFYSHNDQPKVVSHKFTGQHQENVNKQQLLNPGPGSYNPSTAKHAPSFRVGRSTRRPLSHAETATTPGPGTYHQELKMNQVNTSFSKEARKTPTPATTPGPGSYEWKTPDKVTVHRFASGHSDNLNKEQLFVPGPGSYNPDKLRDSPKFSAGVRRLQHVESVKHNFPGPGAYSTNRPKTSVNVKFSKERRKSAKIEDSPGPGQYITKTPTETKVHRFPSIGHQENLNVLYTPGPGTYKTFDSGSSPAFRITAKRQLLEESVKYNYPGPGSYRSTERRCSSPTWSFGKEPRPDFKANDSPGPGSYLIKDTSDKKANKFASSGHPQQLEKDSSPGPGSYKIPCSVPLPGKHK